MTVRPRRLPSGGRARRVEQARLREQDERPLGGSAEPRLTLGCSDLLECAANVHRRRSAAGRIAPGNWAVESPVDLVRGQPVPVSAQLPAVPLRKSIAGDPQQRLRRQIAQHRTRRGKVGQRSHGLARDDVSAQRTQICGERVRETLSAAARKHPAGDVGQRAEHETEGGRGPPVERQHAVAGDAGKQRAGVGAAECTARQRLGRLQRPPTESRQDQGMPGKAQRPEDRSFEPWPVCDDSAYDAAVS